MGEQKKKKCPLIKITQQSGEEPLDCIGDECGFWHDTAENGGREGCAVPIIADAVEYLGYYDHPDDEIDPPADDVHIVRPECFGKEFSDVSLKCRNHCAHVPACEKEATENAPTAEDEGAGSKLQVPSSGKGE